MNLPNGEPKNPKQQLELKDQSFEPETPKPNSTPISRV